MQLISKKYIALIVISLLVIVIYFLSLLLPNSNNNAGISTNWTSKCPENYINEEDRAKALALFYARYKSENPESDIGQMAEARINFLIKNKCVKTLKTIDKNGGFQDYIANIVNDSIKNSIKCPNDYNTINGFSDQMMKDARMYISANASSTSNDFFNFYEQSLIDRGCKKNHQNE